MRTIEAQRRRHIIDSTIAVLVRDGLAGVSLSRVAAEAHVAKGILCYYFATKDGLLDAVLASVQGRIVSDLIEEASQFEDPWERVTAFICGHLSYVRRNRDEVLALRHLASTRAGGSDISDHLAVWREQKDWLVETLVMGQGRGVFRAFEPAIVAMSVLGAVESALLAWAHDETLDLDHYAEQLLEMFGNVVWAYPPEPQRAFA